jgi:hypothetical protein
LIASGWQTCGIAMRMVVSRILVDSDRTVRRAWPTSSGKTGAPGDTLYLTLDVLERRVATSKPTLGIVRWRWRMRNQVAAWCSTWKRQPVRLGPQEITAVARCAGLSASARA